MNVNAKHQTARSCQLTQLSWLNGVGYWVQVNQYAFLQVEQHRACSFRDHVHVIYRSSERS